MPHPSGERRGVVTCLGTFNERRNLRAGASRMNGMLVGGPTAPNGRGLGAIVLRSRVSVIYRGGDSIRRSFLVSPVRAIISNR